MSKLTLQAALDYAISGTPVFPCRISNKAPYNEHGFKEATTDPIQIKCWWANHPDAIIGMPTGKTTGLVVVDIDPRHGGDYSLQGLEGKHGDLPDTLTAMTGGGGTHYYFRYPGREIRCSTGKIASGIDIKADGGYVILPPSGHESGKNYYWDGDFDLNTVAEMPRWLLNLIDNANKMPAISADGNEIPEGGRNNTLASLAGKMRHSGMGQQEILAALLVINQQRCKPPMPESEVSAIAKSVSRYEPDQAAVIAVEGAPDVDISGILAQSSDATPVKDKDDPGLIPESYFFEVPGFVNAYIEHCVGTMPYKRPGMAFCGAMACLSWLVGRKVKCPGGMRANIYILGVAGSGGGKDWARKINGDIFDHVGASACLGKDFASGEGLEDKMAQNLCMLFQNDEIDALLQCMKSGKEGRYERLMATLLSFYTSSDSIVPMRAKAGQEVGAVIRQPHLVLFGTATTENFYGAFNERMLTNGLFSRMMILDMGEDRGLFHQPGDRENIPEPILHAAKFWHEKTLQYGGNLSWENPRPITVPYSGKAEQILFDYNRETDGYYQQASDEVTRVAWSRAGENARKLALLYACSESHTCPQISEAAATWAMKFISHQIKRQLYQISVHYADSPFHKLCLKAVERIRKERGGKISRSKLSRYMKVKPKELDDIINTLEDQERIELVDANQTGKGRRGSVYRLLSN